MTMTARKPLTLHRLRATPRPGWLEAAQRQLSQEQLCAMDGQSLAVLALAVSGLPWPAQAAWVRAVMARWQT